MGNIRQGWKLFGRVLTMATMATMAAGCSEEASPSGTLPERSGSTDLSSLGASEDWAIELDGQRGSFQVRPKSMHFELGELLADLRFSNDAGEFELLVRRGDEERRFLGSRQASDRATPLSQLGFTGLNLAGDWDLGAAPSVAAQVRDEDELEDIRLSVGATDVTAICEGSGCQEQGIAGAVRARGRGAAAGGQLGPMASEWSVGAPDATEPAGELRLTQDTLVLEIGGERELSIRADGAVLVGSVLGVEFSARRQ